MHRLVDSHAHLEELDDLEAGVQRARQAGVTAIVAVGSEYESNNRVMEIAAKYPDLVYPALGLHPGSLDKSASSVERELQFIEDNVSRAVGIGEVGLDYHKRVVAASGKDLQKQVLASVLAMARRYSKPAIVHSRYAWRDSFDLANDADVEQAVFHWYTGPTNVLKDILGRGYFVSATLAVEYHAEHRRAVKEAPLESLLLETDSPVFYRGHQAEPADVSRVLQATAELKGLPPEAVAQASTENAARLFGIQC
jgi:TatD DNase family protein